MTPTAKSAMSPRRRTITVTAIMVGALMLSSCASAAPDAPADDTEQRTLVVYSGREEELIAPLIEQFEEASGINVETRYADTTTLAAQIIEEGDKTAAEVFLSQDAGALGALSAADLLTTLPTSITEKVDPQYTSTDGSWVGITGRARVIAYDSQTYTSSEIPDDVFELLDPQWKGKVGIAPSNASFQSFVTALRVSEGEDRAREWLDGIVANEPKIFAKNGEILEAVNNGGVELGLINHYYWAGAEQDPETMRAQIKFGAPGTVSALVNVSGAGILAGASASSEAKEFVSYLVDEEAQTYFVEKTFEYPLVAGIPEPQGVPPLESLGGPDINLSDLASLDETITLITEAGLL